MISPDKSTGLKWFILLFRSDMKNEVIFYVGIFVLYNFNFTYKWN